MKAPRRFFAFPAVAVLFSISCLGGEQTEKFEEVEDNGLPVLSATTINVNGFDSFERTVVRVHSAIATDRRVIYRLSINGRVYELELGSSSSAEPAIVRDSAGQETVVVEQCPDDVVLKLDGGMRSAEKICDQLDNDFRAPDELLLVTREFISELHATPSLQTQTVPNIFRGLDLCR